MKKIIGLLFLIIVFSSCSQKNKNDTFHFYVVTDVHEHQQRPDYTNLCFEKDILTDIKKDTAGLGKFIVVTGDMDPFHMVNKSVQKVLGKDFRFYPVIGNHDVGQTNNQYKDYPEVNWGDAFDIVSYNHKNLKNISNWGPDVSTPALNDLVYKDSLSGKEYVSSYDKNGIKGAKYTTYSFDEGNSHFVVLDIYSGLRFKGAEHAGRISNELYKWLEEDLIKTKKENIFIFAHQPVWTSPDDGALVNESYRSFLKERSHKEGIDSLAWFKEEYESKIKPREDFWNLLKKYHVVAYFCGHTHKYSANNIDGIWEINLEFGAWNIEGRTRYGEIFVDNKKVELVVKVYKEKTKTFDTLWDIVLKE